MCQQTFKAISLIQRTSEKLHAFGNVETFFSFLRHSIHFKVRRLIYCSIKEKSQTEKVFDANNEMSAINRIPSFQLEKICLRSSESLTRSQTKTARDQ